MEEVINAYVYIYIWAKNLKRKVNVVNIKSGGSIISNMSRIITEIVWSGLFGTG
jgi:hypothetical protein